MKYYKDDLEGDTTFQRIFFVFDVSKICTKIFSLQKEIIIIQYFNCLSTTPVVPISIINQFFIYTIIHTIHTIVHYTILYPSVI